MKAVVIGAGVVGLTSAIELQAAGFAVTIVAAQVTPHNTSDAAAAFWYPAGAGPPARARQWAAAGLARLTQLASEPAAGIRHVPLLDYWPRHAPLPDWPVSVERHEVPAYPPKRRDFIRLTVPRIEVPRYMVWLRGRFLAAGGQLVQRTLAMPAEAGPAPVIVNSTGVGARRLAPDLAVTARRGQVVRLARPPALPSTIVHIHTDDELTYIVPRDEDVILGGTSQTDAWSLEPVAATAAAIVDRCAAYAPSLASAAVLGHQVGLRPYRPTVRLEAEPIAGGVLIHNYGHGSVGHSLAWGCAAEVAALASRFRDNAELAA